jgi:hypothetical protein
LKVAGFNGKSQPFTLFDALLLVRRSSANGSIESDIIGFSVSWTSLDIAPAFAIGM